MEIEPGMKDFELRPKKHEIENPHNLSVFADRPKFITDKERELNEKYLADQKFAASGKPHDFIKYYKLQPKRIPMSQAYKDKHNKVNGPVKD